MQLASLTSTGLSKVTVKSPLFDTAANPILLAQAVRIYLSRQRQGTAKTKTRGEVNRTKKKWYKQKHTGGARHGARTPNIFVGGGVSHGPTGTQNWWMELTGQMKRQAVGTALAAQAEQVILFDLNQDAKVLRKSLTSLKSERILVVTAVSDATLVKSIGNMSEVLITTAERVNALDILNADFVVLTEETLTAIETRLAAKEVVEKKEVAEVAPKKVAAKKPAAKKPSTTKTKTA